MVAFKQTEVKNEGSRKKYYCWKKERETKISSRYQIKGINVLAVLLVNNLYLSWNGWEKNSNLLTIERGNKWRCTQGFWKIIDTLHWELRLFNRNSNHTQKIAKWGWLLRLVTEITIEITQGKQENKNKQSRNQNKKKNDLWLWLSLKKFAHETTLNGYEREPEARNRILINNSTKYVKRRNNFKAKIDNTLDLYYSFQRWNG